MDSDPRDRRAREIQAAINGILFNDWDPIGVKAGAEANPGLRDEYARYVGAVYRALASGASDVEVAALLRRIEKESMGFSVSEEGLLPVARKLRALDVRVG